MNFLQWNRSQLKREPFKIMLFKLAPLQHRLVIHRIMLDIINSFIVGLLVMCLLLSFLNAFPNLMTLTLN